MSPLFATIHIGKHEGKLRRKDFTNLTSPPDRPNVPTKAQRKRGSREEHKRQSKTAAPTTCSQHDKKSAEGTLDEKGQEPSGGRM